MQQRLPLVEAETVKAAAAMEMVAMAMEGAETAAVVVATAAVATSANVVLERGAAGVTSSFYKVSVSSSTSRPPAAATLKTT